mmetsp:Transcript_10990/g.44546  ORF Transcript_10990/g.44546 Transcript_10990/m.44546 type:complete len:218 (-) Transcript_10990:95-748(-)
MRSLTSSMPWCSAFRTFIVSVMSKVSVLWRPHGIAVSQSRYDRVTLNSAEFFSRDCNLASSSSIARFASFGMTPPCGCSSFSFCALAASSSWCLRSSSGSSNNAILSLYFWMSASLSSCSTPSSFLIALSCSLSMKVRCCDEIFCSTCCEISCCSLESSRSLPTNSSAKRSRSATSRASSAACNCGASPVARAAAKSANLYGSPMSTRCAKKCMCSR